MYSFSIKLNFFKKILLTPHFWTVVFYPDMRNRLFIYLCLCCLCIYTFISIKGALSVFCQTMLIFERTKTNTPIAQQDPPLFSYLSPTRTYTTLGITTITETSEDTSIFKLKPTQISFVKQCKLNITHLSWRNRTTSVSDSRPSRSLSSLQCWKTARIFTQVLPLVWSYLFFLMFCSSDVFLFLIFHFSLSIVNLLISVLCTKIECCIITRHAPYCWLAACEFWDMVRHCGLKRFFF